jgi:hypothetical protein
VVAREVIPPAGDPQTLCTKEHNISKQSIVAFAFGVVFVVTLLVLAIAFPTPTSFQYTVFRIILALAAAGVAAMIPGFIRLKLSPSSALAIQAGGAIAVFVIVYFFNPAQLAVEVPPSEAVVSVSIQDYHILHGATASPVTLESVSGPAAGTDAIVNAIWEKIFPEITPEDKHVDLQIAILITCLPPHNVLISGWQASEFRV